MSSNQPKTLFLKTYAKFFKANCMALSFKINNRLKSASWRKKFAEKEGAMGSVGTGQYVSQKVAVVRWQVQVSFLMGGECCFEFSMQALPINTNFANWQQLICTINIIEKFKWCIGDFFFFSQAVTLPQKEERVLLLAHGMMRRIWWATVFG